jgi:hypothetical protein
MRQRRSPRKLAAGRQAVDGTRRTQAFAGLDFSARGAASEETLNKANWAAVKGSLAGYPK